MVRRPGKGAVAAASGVLLCGAALLWTLATPNAFLASMEPRALPADGLSTAEAVVRFSGLAGERLPLRRPAPDLSMMEGAELGATLWGPDSEGRYQVRSGGKPGLVRIAVRVGGLGEQVVPLRLVPDAADRDGDGFPDAAELLDGRDVDAFLSWFAAIAEAQYYRPFPSWAEVHRDCAGLLRFAYKEALRPHGKDWLAQARYLPGEALPSVARFAYPQVPFLGDRIFRTAAGAFRSGDEARLFSASASAAALRDHNTRFVSYTETGARRGDLLFFRDSENGEFPDHAMIYLGLQREGAATADGHVVYHTGPMRDDSGALGAGEVRLASLRELRDHPDPRWRPRRDNPHFLGFHRWRIAMRDVAGEELVVSGEHVAQHRALALGTLRDGNGSEHE